MVIRAMIFILLVSCCSSIFAGLKIEEGVQGNFSQDVSKLKRLLNGDDRFEYLKREHEQVTLKLDQFYEELLQRKLLFRNTVLVLLDGWYQSYQSGSFTNKPVEKLNFYTKELRRYFDGIDRLRIELNSKQFIKLRLNELIEYMQSMKLRINEFNNINVIQAKATALISKIEKQIVSAQQVKSLPTPDVAPQFKGPNKHVLNDHKNLHIYVAIGLFLSFLLLEVIAKSLMRVKKTEDVQLPNIPEIPESALPPIPEIEDLVESNEREMLLEKVEEIFGNTFTNLNFFLSQSDIDLIYELNTSKTVKSKWNEQELALATSVVSRGLYALIKSSKNDLSLVEVDVETNKNGISLYASLNGLSLTSEMKRMEQQINSQLREFESAVRFFEREGKVELVTAIFGVAIIDEQNHRPELLL